MLQATASQTPAYDFLKSAVNRRNGCTIRNANRRKHHTYFAVLPWATDLVNAKASEERCLKLIAAFKEEVAAMIPGNYTKNLDTVNSFIKKHQPTNAQL